MKTQGVTPGFTIRDGRGDIYFIKFDPPRHPQLTTSAEVIATKFFHAFGYNVPENYLSLVRIRDLEISPDARLEDKEGKERPVREKDIHRIFQRAYRLPDERTPVVASRLLSGTPLGPFEYFSTRSDDPNDIFPHENRRELRGLRVFSAWLNHDDSRSINSQDMYVGKPGEGHVRHYLLDFGSCFGSGSIKEQSRRAGNEYIFEWGPILKAGITLGIWDRRWRHVKYRDYPSIGRFEGNFFLPQSWRPEYPNPAFERMKSSDAFWATRIVMRFTNDMIRAMVGTGRLSDPNAENHLVETLIKRRDRIVHHYLSQINPLDTFELSSEPSPRLKFENLGSGALASSSSYQYQWFRFDNEMQTVEALTEPTLSATPSLPIPASPSSYWMVRIRTLAEERPQWQKKVEIFLRNRPSKMKIVGIEREP